MIETKRLARINELAHIAKERQLTPEELEKATDHAGWCDVCKGWEEDRKSLYSKIENKDKENGERKNV